MPPSIKLIVNPQAGRGEVRRQMPAIREILAHHGLEYAETWSEKPGDAVEMAHKAAKDGYPLVVAVGGDGTVQEVANGILQADSPSTALGILPVGSASDFAYSVGIPTDLEAACRILKEGKGRLIDVGRIEGDRFFLNAAGVGFDAQVAMETLKMKRLRGFAMYLVAVFRTLRAYELPKVTIDLDGRKMEQTITLAVAANGRRYGGGFHIAPAARLDDGLFEVCIGRGLSRLGILRLLPEVMRGTHVDKEPVTMAQAKQVIIESEDPLAVHADGEIVATEAHRLALELEPKRLQIMMPQEKAGR